MWWPGTELNRRRQPFQLSQRSVSCASSDDYGGSDGTRTRGLLLDRAEFCYSCSRRDVLSLCVQRQTGAIGVFLRFFRFGILALEVGERHVERLLLGDS
jgi:hypothetical protein